VDGVEHPYVRLSDLTKDWEFEPYATLLKKERKEGVVGRGRPAKSVEMRGKLSGSRNERFGCREKTSKVMIQADK
jgi:hypothetical protein